MRRRALVRLAFACVALACEGPRAPSTSGESTAIATPATATAPTVTPAAANAAIVTAPAVTPAWSDAVPGDPAEIQEWLQRFVYRGWAPQTAVRMTGEHGGERLYFNATLVASLAAGAQEHPVGSAAVRELYAGDLTTLKGFALMHKTGPSGPVGEGWYWYEIFGADAGARPTVAEAGARGCVGCHAHAVDFVHSPDTPRDDPQPLL